MDGGGGRHGVKVLNAGQALATVLVDELVRCGLSDTFVAPGSPPRPWRWRWPGIPASGRTC